LEPLTLLKESVHLPVGRQSFNMIKIGMSRQHIKRIHPD